MHTPAVGLTLRSLSHNISLVPRSPITSSWHWLPNPQARRRLNLLLLPWPDHVAADRFRGLWAATARRLVGGQAFFSADLAVPTKLVVARARQALEAASRLVDRIDALVFPEAALEASAAAVVSDALDVTVIGGFVGHVNSRREGGR